mmetsp:Transcript_38749/g.51057  ORF Transcript_38749/g.51057 Transcript_38749/m.51057 type:complete len:158 (+) Transcript_38749:197-670(+)|eukprot:CAMPEP_0117735466 /NCGR_PEP_ID=MMETSP0947-20121206/1318_1 /TAXON_ID=44440 /ORGANISM="Chattonella subsalsa, Strain CCMP2191" /LENGTH=157 /DNA_ID=CAMNT_0005550505 /DNA_START=113 /DNA_END=586 /DNA_ORIENTATION=-
MFRSDSSEENSLVTNTQGDVLVRKGKFSWEEGYALEPLWHRQYLVISANCLKLYENVDHFTHHPARPNTTLTLKKNHDLTATKTRDYSLDPAKTIMLEYFTIVKHVLNKTMPVMKLAVLSPDNGFLSQIRDHLETAHLHLSRAKSQLKSCWQDDDPY